jgi:putative phosphoesterase
MPVIGLLSDTHAHLDDRLLPHLMVCDELWHAGDIGSLSVLERLRSIKPFRGVYGNIDGPEIRATLPEILRFEVAGVPVMMVHIGGYPGKYPKDIRKKLLEDPPAGGLFISGHSHILKVVYDQTGGFLHLNPGACGNEGWHTVKTMLRFRLQDSTISHLEVVEMPR